MSKRRRSALTTLALAAAALFALPASPASAGSATTPNACANSVTANFSQIGVTTSGDDGLTSVAPGGTTTTTGLNQSGAVPGAIFVAGYNLGLLVVGPNTIPAVVNTKIEATNTTQGQQTTNTASTSVNTTISDPDGTPGTGDETGTDATFNTNYSNLTWTAGASGTIDYRQQSIATWPATDANNTLRIQATVGGFLQVIFRCAPGTVTPPDPGTVALIDPAGSFDTTNIVAPNVPPIANAGADQTVDSGATVNLDGTGSTDPNAGDTLNYSWSQTSGPPVTLTGANTATPSFTAPTGPADLTFTLTVCDRPAGDPDQLCDTATVSVHVNAPAASTISIGDASATEGGAETFTVTLSAPQAAAVTVDFATADGTAVAPGDYTAATGTVTFAPGDVSETVTVNTIDDNDVEGTETFDVNLSNPTGNASIADGTGVGTINDNDVANVPPTAAAGADQTVDSGATVNLDGTGSTDTDGTIVSYAWLQTAGPSVTLTGADTATPSFTAPTGPATLTFQLTVTDNDGATGTDSVTISVNPPPMIDASGQVIVNGPVSHTKTAKNFVFKVTNVGTTSITINSGDITSSVDVNGTTTGSVSVAGLPVTIGPGASKRLKLTWSYGSALVGGETVVFNACVNLTGDIDTSNDCDSATVTAK
jgi:K319L-like, PKD domain/Calx-beta domain